MYDFQGKTCPCIESVRAGFGKKGLEATVGLLQGPGNGRAQQRSAERKEQEADAEQPAFPSEGSAGLRRRTGAGERLAGKDAVRRRSHSAVSALKEGPAARALFARNP